MAAIVGNKFTTTGYTSNNGGIYKARISNASRAAQPTSDTGPATTRDGSAGGNNVRRRIGMHMRGVRLTRKVGTSPNVVTYSTFLPLLLAADYVSLSDNSAITVGGVAWTVAAHIAEKFK